jgi:hypothetical protein
MLHFRWAKTETNAWFPLNSVDVEDLRIYGVYVIWHEGDPGRVVCVGQGNIRDRLKFHRRNPEVQKFAKFGGLRVMWAAVPAHQVDGVERYLADYLKPLIVDYRREAPPIAVNL